jgi:hypothetical protein
MISSIPDNDSARGGAARAAAAQPVPAIIAREKIASLLAYLRRATLAGEPQSSELVQRAI